MKHTHLFLFLFFYLQLVWERLSRLVWQLLGSDLSFKNPLLFFFRFFFVCLFKSWSYIVEATISISFDCSILIRVGKIAFFDFISMFASFSSMSNLVCKRLHRLILTDCRFWFVSKHAVRVFRLFFVLFFLEASVVATISLSLVWLPILILSFVIRFSIFFVFFCPCWFRL